MRVLQAEMDFDGLREDKVPPLGGVPQCTSGICETRGDRQS
jgi:hypothetical protein